MAGVVAAEKGGMHPSWRGPDRLCAGGNPVTAAPSGAKVWAVRTRQSRAIHGTAASKNCALFDVSQFYRAALVLGAGVDNLSSGKSLCAERGGPADGCSGPFGWRCLWCRAQAWHAAQSTCVLVLAHAARMHRHAQAGCRIAPLAHTPCATIAGFSPPAGPRAPLAPADTLAPP